MNNSLLILDGITRTFRQGDKDLPILRGASAELKKGEMVGLVAPSGAGKSTLLHIAGLLERPDQGEIIVCGQNCSAVSDDRRTKIRRVQIGFVYQFHHLLPEFSALENVFIPQMIAGTRKVNAKNRAAELLDMVGLTDRYNHRPAKLSGGEQQRVAIARALANDPRILIADEPTGNLDQETAQTVFKLLTKITREAGVAAFVATHNETIVEEMDRTLKLKNGVLESV